MLHKGNRPGKNRSKRVPIKSSKLIVEGSLRERLMKGTSVGEDGINEREYNGQNKRSIVLWWTLRKKTFVPE